jgi:hypothetical protein
MDGNMFTYNNPMGMKNEPIMREGILISGLPFPPFLSANYLQDGHQIHHL